MNFITARLAPPDPKNDGKQTPMKGHPVFIAQHATATCCCGQLEKWYQIEKGKALDDDEVGYVVNLVMECREGQIQSLYPEISIFYGHVSTGNVKYRSRYEKV